MTNVPRTLLCIRWIENTAAIGRPHRVVGYSVHTTPEAASTFVAEHAQPDDAWGHITALEDRHGNPMARVLNTPDTGALVEALSTTESYYMAIPKKPKARDPALNQLCKQFHGEAGISEHDLPIVTLERIKKRPSKKKAPSPTR